MGLPRDRHKCKEIDENLKPAEMFMEISAKVQRSDVMPCPRQEGCGVLTVILDLHKNCASI